jgi:molybdopterin-guanine dinucleotide biosynthesis protein A
MKKIAGQAIFADGKGAVPRTPRGIEPLAAVYPTRILDLVSRQIRQTSDRSMHALVENGIHSGLLEWYEVGIAEIPRFFNWNHPRPI